MARLTIGQKAERVLLLLLGLRKNKVATVLVAHGFKDSDLAEGWELLRRLTRTRLGAIAVIAMHDPGLITMLDDWENQWFPIAEASLKRRVPVVHRWMFRNLAQTEGPAVIVSVSTFVDRWDSLSEPKDQGGPDEGGEDAKTLLATRGLTEAVIDEARQLLTRAGQVEPAIEDNGAPAGDDDFAKAEADLWAWYLEWSTIAQTKIKSRRLLRELGFRRTTSSKGGAEEEEEEEEKKEDAANAKPGADAHGKKPKGG